MQTHLWATAPGWRLQIYFGHISLYSEIHNIERKGSVFSHKILSKVNCVNISRWQGFFFFFHPNSFLAPWFKKYIYYGGDKYSSKMPKNDNNKEKNVDSMNSESGLSLFKKYQTNIYFIEYQLYTRLCTWEWGSKERKV